MNFLSWHEGTKAPFQGGLRREGETLPRKIVATAFVGGLLAGLILGIAGCASATKKSSESPQPSATSPSGSSTHADQQGAANVATGAITGLSYQSVLPMGMVILLTVIVLSQTASNSFEDWLLHRQEMARLKDNGGHAPCP